MRLVQQWGILVNGLTAEPAIQVDVQFLTGYTSEKGKEKVLTF